MSFNILVVDDSETVRAVIIKTLRLARVPINNLYEAQNGSEALDVLRREWVDLAFADLNMPVMNGIVLIDKMSEDGLLDAVPVIIVSTEGSVTRIEQLKSKGIKAYVRKPFTPELLRNVVYEILGLKTQPNKNKLLSSVLADILEEFAFVFAEETAPEPQIYEGLTGYRAEIAFEGPVTGTLTMVAMADMCADLASNILWETETPDQDRTRGPDAFREVVSMTSGHVLTALAGDRAEFELRPPDVRQAAPEDWSQLMDDPETLAFSVTGLPLLVRLFIAEPSAAPPCNGK